LNLMQDLVLRLTQKGSVIKEFGAIHRVNTRLSNPRNFSLSGSGV